jgi:hypothetical protein
VTLTNSKGLSRITSTSAFGYYQFSDVATGQTYTISVRSKRYLFQSRTVELNAELANVDFVALE